MPAQREPPGGFDYAVVVIGSGFGGSVTALRLTEKGYRVGVLEAGQRFGPHNLPSNSWALRNFLWAPKLGLKGMQRIHLLKNVVILAGAGVGGGSLNYANTLYEPALPFFADPQWAHITDWHAELAPFYAQAKRMLGVVPNPTMTPADIEMKRLAEQFGRGTPSVSRRSGCSSAGTVSRSRAGRSPTRSSAAPVPSAPDASSAASAASA